MAVSTAKTILRGYRKEGRIGPKITRTKFHNFEMSNPKNDKPVRKKYIISYKEDSPYHALSDISYQQENYIGKKMKKAVKKFTNRKLIPIDITYKNCKYPGPLIYKYYREILANNANNVCNF